MIKMNNYMPKSLTKWREKAESKYIYSMLNRGINNTTFYIIKFWKDKELFIKVGITCNLEKRFNAESSYNTEVLYSLTLPLQEAWNLETLVLNTLYKEGLYYKPVMLKVGTSECFTIAALDIIPTILSDINNNRQLILNKAIIANSKPETFFMSFINDSSNFYKLKSLSDIHILYKLCIISEFNTGIVNLSTATRANILLELSITNSQMSKSLKSLVSLELISGSKGRYIINPAVFWKGDAKSREALMKNNSINITISID